MRLHTTGLMAWAVIVLLGLLAGAEPAVVAVRIALALYMVAAFLEVVANMVRDRNTHVRGRLLAFLFERNQTSATRSN